MANAKKDSSAETAEAAAPAEKAEAPQTHEASGKRPLWSRQLNRVQCSIWKHDQNGRTRYTTLIYRTYLDRRNNEWKRVYYFDKNDLKDVRSVTSEAEDQILRLEGFEVVTSDD